MPPAKIVVGPKCPNVRTFHSLTTGHWPLLYRHSPRNVDGPNFMAPTSLYWIIGTSIRQNVLQEKRAGYGEQIVSAQSTQLTAELGPGYTENRLRRMIQFVGRFANEEIVAAVSRELCWSQFVELILDIRVRVVTDLCVPGDDVAPRSRRSG